MQLQEQQIRETENEILRLKSVNQQIAKETEQIENEIEQLDRENARLETLISCVDRLCFPPESSSTPVPPTGSDCGPS